MGEVAKVTGTFVRHRASERCRRASRYDDYRRRTMAPRKSSSGKKRARDDTVVDDDDTTASPSTTRTTTTATAVKSPPSTNCPYLDTINCDTLVNLQFPLKSGGSSVDRVRRNGRVFKPVHGLAVGVRRRSDNAELARQGTRARTILLFEHRNPTTGRLKFLNARGHSKILCNRQIV